MRRFPALAPAAAAQVFGRAHSTRVWLGVLAFVLHEPAARGLVILAMVAVALLASASPRAHPAPETPACEAIESDHGP